MKNKDNVFKDIATGLAITAGASAITEVIRMVRGLNSSFILITDWDNSFQNINKLLYEMDPGKYIRNRRPTTNKEIYQLNSDTSYIIKVDNRNYIKVDAYENTRERMIYPENKLKLTIFGRDRYRIRMDILRNAQRMTDKKHIRVKHLNSYNITCDIIPHSFDNIVLNDSIKDRIMSGLINWSKSESWYSEHQMCHKIGVLLYGKPGTGKSSIAKAVSSMFSNAPILTIDPKNMMASIDGIVETRKQVSDILVVLIEDVDMFFKRREELEGIRLSAEDQEEKSINQNALFQLLDGIYSTDNTIYIATTNYKDRIDEALVRYGRFDIQEELDYFDEKEALSCVELLGYDQKVLDSLNVEYPVQPSYLQSMIMEYRAKSFKHE